MSPRALRTLCCLALVICAAGAAATEPLGRLFFTPERRALLDRQRQTNVRQAESMEGASVSLDGIVTRSSGKRTVWVNGRPQDDSSPDLGVNVVQGRSPGEATVSAGDEAPVPLRVGESLNWATREKRDGLQGGKVIVRPPARTP